MFRVGQKVVCIDDSDDVNMRGYWDNCVVKGQIYTIREINCIHINDPTIDCVRLVEVGRRGAKDDPLAARRFRPIVDTDISIFTAMLKEKKIEELV